MPGKLNRLLSNTANKLGYEVIPLWRIGKLPLVSLLKDVFARHQIDTVLDVGANKGQFADFLRLHLGFKGRIISFEPIQGNYNLLQQRATCDSNWQVYGFALGKEDAVAQIHVTTADVFSSFLKPNETGRKTFKECEIEHLESVDVRRLDGLVDEIGLNAQKGSVFLKCDTQGFDLEVIAGCGELVRDFRGIQTEVSVVGIYEGMPSIFNSYRALSELDYGLAGLFPVTQDSDLKVIEFDAVFVNNRFGVLR